jgi:OOP family OmpA-OmpF porin
MNPTKSIRALVIVALPLAIAACSQDGFMGSPGELDTLMASTPTGSAFTQNLSKDYLVLAQTNKSEYNWPVMSLWAHKGLQANNGVAVAPEVVSDWSYAPLQLGGVNGTFFVPDSSAVPALNEARGRLVAMLGGSGPNLFPVLAATAQTKFECWLEGTHEAVYGDNAVTCRKEFEDAMASIAKQSMTQAVAPAPVSAPTSAPAAIVSGYQVFFDFDKSNISADAHAILAAVAANMRKNNVTQVALTGHTDTVGTETYNMALSLRRANAAKAALVSLGVPADHISVAGKGKTEPLVQTGDGVREPKNRRVEIVLPQ